MNGTTAYMMSKNSSSAGNGAVSSVNSRTGTVVLTKIDVGLANVTNEAQIPLTQKGAASGVAPLDASGKVPIANIPVGLVNIVTVADQTARLALPQSTNLTLALQADTKIEWAINANTNPSVSANWVNCGSYAAAVASINGATGAVTIDLASLNGVPKTTTVNGKALSGNIALGIGDLITLNADSSYYIGGDGALHQLSSSVPITDHASSGYFDIGTMRIQWGKAVTSAAGVETVTLPAPFSNTNYCPTVTMLATQAMVVGMISSLTTTNFTVRKVFYNTGGAFGNAGEWFTWIAIGLKP